MGRWNCLRGNLKNPRFFGLTIGVFLFALCSISEAQRSERSYRIGYISNRTKIGPYEEALREHLRELGYVEGKNLFIEWRFVGGQPDRYSQAAVELVRLNVDCLVTTGLGASRAAKDATSTIPIIMANVSDDPVRNKLVNSLARPGGNISGFTDIAPELAGKRLELIKETVQNASRVAVLWYSASPIVAGKQLKETEIAAAPLGIRVQSLEVQRPEDFEPAFQAARSQGTQALIGVSFGGLLVNNMERVVTLAIKYRLPGMYTNSLFVDAGGLMSYSPDALDRFRRTATYVDKILKGTKPADLPVQQPAKFELIINLKAAKQIGLTIPPNVLARADRVIK
jgi:putative ABC transport system substrate-binding protein